LAKQTGKEVSGMERAATVSYATGVVCGVVGLTLDRLTDGQFSHAIAITMMIVSTVMLFAGVYVLTLCKGVHTSKKIARAAYACCFVAFFIGAYHEDFFLWPIPEAIMAVFSAGLLLELASRHSGGDPPDV